MVKRNNNNWEALSMTERASLINTYIQNGVLDLKKMKEHYNGFDDGGRILDGKSEKNQTLSNIPTREMTPSEAAAINKTLNKSQYMLAVGDSPDDPAYLSTDVLEPAVVKAFNSTEDYNRYQGEKFGEYVAEGMNNVAPYVLEAAMLPFTISGALETPMLLYQGAKVLPQAVKLGKSAFRKGKKYFGKKVLGMVDDIENYVNTDSHFRIVDRPAIDDAINTGTIRAKTGLYHGTPEYLKANFSKYLDNIPGWEQMDAVELRKLLESKGAFNNLDDAAKLEAKLKIRNSTNRGGTVHYFKGRTYPNYRVKPSHFVIETPHNHNIFVAGHGGREYGYPLGEWGASLLKTDGNIKGASIPAKGSSYWEYNPFWEMWKKKKFATGGPTEEKYNIFEDELSFERRDNHRKSLENFVKQNPTIGGINTADFVEFFNQLSGLEGSYKKDAGEGKRYSGYYGLEGGRNYDPNTQHQKAYEHLARLFKNSIVKEDLARGIKLGFTPAQILAKYWNQGNRVTNYLYNGKDDNDDAGSLISEYGWNMTADVDYSKYLPQGIADDYVVIKDWRTLGKTIPLVRNSYINYSDRENSIIDLNTQIKRDRSGNPKAVFDPTRLQVNDTVWLKPLTFKEKVK